MPNYSSSLLEQAAAGDSEMQRAVKLLGRTYGGLTANAAPAAVPPTSGQESFSRDRWYVSPELAWTDGGQAYYWPDLGSIEGSGGRGIGVELFRPEIPEQYARYFEDPRLFYDFYQANLANEPAAAATLAAAGIAADEEDAWRNRALSRLEGFAGSLEEELDRFEADPIRAQLRNELLRRTGQQYSLISDEERTALELQLAQAAARAGSAQTQRAAARGVLGSGADIQRAAGLQTIASAGGVQLGGKIATANEQARQQALTALGQFLGGEERLRQAYQGALGDVTGMAADIEAGVDVQPPDLLALEALRYAKEQYERESAERGEALETYEESLETDVFDWAEMLLNFLGGGGGQILGNIF